MAGNVVVVTADNFEVEVLQANGPVIVDFWADWCGPCKNIAPILEEMAGRPDNTAKIVKINADAEFDLATKYDVRGLPTIKRFENGEVVSELTAQAASNKDNIRKLVGLEA